MHTCSAFTLKLAAFLSWFFVIWGLFCFPFLLSAAELPLKEVGGSGTCMKEAEIVAVRGISLLPLIAPGDDLRVFHDYYDCHAVKKDDLIIYKYAGNPAPIVKIVKGLPGERIRLKPHGDSFLIMVNGVPLKNSAGFLYKVPKPAKKMLELYIKSYPVIPSDAYLILGDNVLPTADSTRFGFVHKKDILGRAQVMRESGSAHLMP